MTEQSTQTTTTAPPAPQKPLSKRQRKLLRSRQKLMRAEESLLNELFNDMYTRRYRIYRVNFTRGLFFGMGSLIGGAIVVTLVVALLTFISNLPGAYTDFLTRLLTSFRR